MKNLFPLILCLCLLLSMLSGCAAEDTPYIPTGAALAPEDADLFSTVPDEEPEPQQLTMAYYADRPLNPLVCTDYTNRTLCSLLYQGLFSVGPDYEPVPILCKGYRVSSDYRKYTFFLNVQATFSDGSRVSIDDVLATYEAAKESKYYKGRFTHVASIALSDDGGIVFSLRTPVEGFPVLLDIPILKASQLEEAHPVGTGPYVLENSLAGAQLRRNYAWWCESPDLAATAETIPLIATESTTQIRDEFEFSDVGLVCADPCSDSYADFRCDYELWDCDNGIFVYLGCNVAYSKDEIFEKNTLRSALTFAIDREKLTTDHYNGFARPTTLPMDPTYPYYSDSLAMKYDYDPVRFIDAMNYVKQPKEPLSLLVNSDDSMRLRIGRDIVDMFTECGLNVELVEKPNNEFIQAIKNGRFDMYLGQTRLPANMDLSEFFRPWGELSWGSVDNEELYNLCKDALDNHGNFYDLHKALADDGRIVPILFCGYAVYADRGLLSDLQPTRDNVFFYTLGLTDADVLIPIDYNNSNG